MGGDPAELGYGHALAMLGDPEAAAEVAESALRRAGRARHLVLAHARAEAVARASRDEPVDIDNVLTVVLDLPALAATLASTRPAEERAALDVRTRTGGDLVALGESLGMRPAEAATSCAEIAELWEKTLDPALLAFSGAGECEGLGAILDATAPDTVAKLLDVAPSVHAHSRDCTICADRVRAMASVRTFFSDAVVEVPDSVRVASRRGRTKRPSAPPVPLFPSSVPARRRIGRPSRFVAAAVLAFAVALGGAAWSNDESGGQPRALTKVAAAHSLAFEGEPDNGLLLRNGSAKAVRYTLSTAANWLQLSPAAGRLGAGEAIPITATLTDDAPEGDVRATVIVHTSSGATTSREFSWTNERAPDIATTLDGCSVGVTIVDDGDLASLMLHWRDTEEHVLDIGTAAERYAAELRPDNGPVTYWVTAADARGNVARTADAVIEPGAC